jgi:hypothetical protein
LTLTWKNPWTSFETIKANPVVVDSLSWFSLERDGFKLNHHRTPDLCWSMIFSENRYPLFRIML